MPPHQEYIEVTKLPLCHFYHVPVQLHSAFRVTKSVTLTVWLMFVLLLLFLIVLMDN